MSGDRRSLGPNVDSAPSGRSARRVGGAGILTLGFGPEHYIQMAIALGRSLRLNSPNQRRAVVSDSSDPQLCELFHEVIPLDSGLGAGVAQKLHLDDYSPFDETLFIDADCLVYRDLADVWSYYQTADFFGVVGNRALGRHNYFKYADLETLLDGCGIEQLPRFNGGIYYFRDCLETTKLFDCARSIYHRRSELGLSPFKGAPVADEPVFGAAMEMLGVSMLDQRHLMVPVLENARDLRRVDVYRGRSTFCHRGNVVTPHVVHFNVTAQRRFVYLRERRRLAAGSSRYRRLASVAATADYIKGEGRQDMRRAIRKPYLALAKRLTR